MRSSGAFWLVLATLVVTLAALCACETVQGDGWGQLLRAHHDGGLTWKRFVALAGYEHAYGNPRWGQLVMILAYQLQVVQLVATPLAITAMIIAALTLVLARWPRPRDSDDAWLLVIVVAVVVITTPQLGAIWFYRPVCCNYIYPLAVQLAWAIPYRFVAARPCPRRGARAAIGMLVLGAIAGAGNEHTGLAFALAAGFAVVVASRRDRAVPAWTMTGLAGLLAGYTWLLAAPGQLSRYSGLADDDPLFGRIWARGVVGNLELPVLCVAWLLPSLILLTAVGVTALEHGRRAARRNALAFVATAGLMVGTCLASPKQVPRLLVAPCMLCAIALGVVLVDAAQAPAVARRLRITATAIVALYSTVLLCVHGITRVDGDERIRRLLSAAPGDIVRVPPLTFAMPTPFSLGEDFRNARLRDRVARALGLAAIELR